jgi:hypothetical protein
MLDGYDSIPFVSNNKQKVCEYIYDLLEYDIEDNKVYHISGDIIECENCTLKNKDDIINCMMKHNTDEYSIIDIQ